MNILFYFLLFCFSIKADFSGSSYDRLICGSSTINSGSGSECCLSRKTDLLSFNFNYFLLLDKLRVTRVNGGAVSQSDGSLLLSSGTNIAGKVIAKSKSMAHSNAGKVVEVTFSALYTKGKANSAQWVGIGDENDGFFIGYNGTTFSIVHRLNSADTIIAQSSFNKDTLPWLTSETLNIFRIKYIWLTGPIVFQVMKSNGEFATFHVIERANQATIAALANVHLPFYAESKNSGNNSDMQVKTSLWNAVLHGELVPTRQCIVSIEDKKITKSLIFRDDDKEDEDKGCGGGGGGTDGFKPLLTLRNKSTISSIPNKGTIRINYFGSSAEDNQPVRFRLVKNATLNTNAYSAQCDYSIAEVDKTATSYTGGDLVFTNSAGRYDTSKLFLKANGFYIDLNSGETLTVAAKTSSNSTDTYASLAWEEYF